MTMGWAEKAGMKFRFNSVARPRHLPKRGILALSRRPLMALWRFAMTGLLVPEDAVLKRI